MTITVRTDTERRAGSCNACSRTADGYLSDAPIRVVLLRPEWASGGTEVRLCPSCADDLKRQL